jgi:hypothetical protein
MSPLFLAIRRGYKEIEAELRTAIDVAQKENRAAAHNNASPQVLTNSSRQL